MGHYDSVGFVLVEGLLNTTGQCKPDLVVHILGSDRRYLFRAEARQLVQARDRLDQLFSRYLTGFVRTRCTGVCLTIGSIPSPTMGISRKGLSLTEQNIRAAFDHARKLVGATDPQQAMPIQSEFRRNQVTTPENK
jgi:hypothetical protein